VSVTPTTSVTTNGHSMAIMSSTQTTTCDTLVTTQSKVNSCMVSTIPRKTFTIRSEKAVRPPEPVIRVSDSTLKRESEAVFRPIEGPTVGSTVGQSVGPIVEPTNKNFDTRSECSSASNDLINNKAKQNFRIILSFNDNGINALDFPSEYENYFKVAFDSRIWGFKSAIEMFHSLPNIFSIEINDKNETLLHDSRFKRFDNPKPVNKIGIDFDSYFCF
jgi:hypothetical protein